MCISLDLLVVVVFLQLKGVDRDVVSLGLTKFLALSELLGLVLHDLLLNLDNG